ncbi:MAG: electron transfer flavoprotein subunit alpha/FixB family protein [Coriobacteriales bacterium]|jgi:electron transfer flavoprotein alpha subunit|nr:electron transfer flavoprotein subunit alpha/FixB family protein [Coriobacteriales bacterium]
MAGIYVYSDEPGLVAELLGFALSTGKQACAVTFSQEDADKAQAFGADKVLFFKGASPLAENYAKALADYLAAEQADLFLAGMTPRGRDLAARVAGYLACGMASDVLSLTPVAEGFTVEKMLYGGVAVLTETLASPAVVTIGSGKFDAPAAGDSPVETLEVPSDMRVRLVTSAPLVQEGVDLNKAEKVVGVGLGFSKQEDLSLAEDLAAVLGAEIGCTRSIAEERKWLPVEQYIGISGAVIKPQLYLSLGISGQIQHVIGVRDAKTIAAINTDENAPIFKAADYGIVGDMYEIAPLLTEALKKV